MAASALRAPFPWFGGKSRAAAIVWRAFGNVPNYVEPFFGSGAVLLARPHAAKIETVNDKDGLVANFWRATKAAPADVASWADWPVNEADLHARHAWLVAQVDGLLERLIADPEYFDAKVAGWWVWGISTWIGNGWCSRDERLCRCTPKLSTGGQGIHAQTRQSYKKPVTGSIGRGVHSARANGRDVFGELAERLRMVRVCCGDWARVVGDPTLGLNGSGGMSPCGVLLDPPYALDAGRDKRLYREDEINLSASVRAWAIERGNNPKLRIALCGWEGEHEMPPTWRCVAWKASNAFANADRERIWFSPHCLPVDGQVDLFSGAA